MEEKKFDLNSLIGFILLGAIMVWWMYNNQPTPEELAKQKAEQIQDFRGLNEYNPWLAFLMLLILMSSKPQFVISNERTLI